MRKSKQSFGSVLYPLFYTKYTVDVYESLELSNELRQKCAGISRWMSASVYIA